MRRVRGTVVAASVAGAAVALLLSGCAELDGVGVVSPTTAVGSPSTTSTSAPPTTSSSAPPTTSPSGPTTSTVVPDPTVVRTRLQASEPAAGAVIELVDVEVARLIGEGQERQLIAGGSFDMGCWQPALTVTPPVSGSPTLVDLVGWIVEGPDLLCPQAVVVWDVAVPVPGDGPVLVNGVPAT